MLKKWKDVRMPFPFSLSPSASAAMLVFLLVGCAADTGVGEKSVEEPPEAFFVSPYECEAVSRNTVQCGWETDEWHTFFLNVIQGGYVEIADWKAKTGSDSNSATLIAMTRTLAANVVTGSTGIQASQIRFMPWDQARNPLQPSYCSNFAYDVPAPAPTSFPDKVFEGRGTGLSCYFVGPTGLNAHSVTMDFSERWLETDRPSDPYLANTAEAIFSSLRFPG